MLEALLSMLDVLKVPFVKKMSSDELKEVPNMPLVLDALCALLKTEIMIDANQEVSIEEQEALQQFDQAKCEIANTISVIAQEGIAEIRDQEESIEDKMLHGSSSSPMKRLY